MMIAILEGKITAVLSQRSLSVATGKVVAVVPIARMPCAIQLRSRSQSPPWVTAVSLVNVSLSAFYSLDFVACAMN